MSKMQEALERQGLSYRDAEAVTGYTAGYLCRVANGVNRPSPIAALKIAKALGLKMTDILEASADEVDA